MHFSMCGFLVYVHCPFIYTENMDAHLHTLQELSTTPFSFILIKINKKLIKNISINYTTITPVIYFSP
ncbi:hypothetical protein Xbed_01726 [Xenorhabdus beddingii]|uniref:Uncharacterized protein n=1 Tax=Xenorhabdus beddingii TaxID=40578 RepID=A0A1Y2SMS6_9GAMM|nr:hypothetical protein Xbed_01726 [Xenorhabdus beddingii]